MIAGLMADGETVIHDADHILRGYDRVVWKLNRLNANVRIEEEQKMTEQLQVEQRYVNL